MAYLQLQDIRRLHIELSSHCNAACPQCDRNVYGAGVNPRLKLTSLSLKDIQKFFSPEFCSQLSEISLSGTHGDPLMAPEAKEIVQYFVESGAGSVQIHTNGGMNSTLWWQQLAHVLRPEDYVTFGIDGLADTHSIYRRGTSWDVVTKHLRAFVEAGGHARWSFLVFRHNEHQIEEAKKLAQEWGCRAFRVRKTGRFQAPGLRHESVPYPVLKTNPGRPVDQAFVEEIYELIPPDYSAELDFKELLKNHGFETLLEEATQQDLRNAHTNVKRLDEVVTEHGNIEEYWNQTQVSCQDREEQQMYLDANGLLWPCCYIGGDIKSWHHEHRFRLDIEEKIISKYGRDFNDLRRHSLIDVLQHPWFQSELEQSWENGLDAPKAPRLKRCGRTCGAKFKPNKFQNMQTSLK